MKQITTGLKWIWKMGKRPYEKYKQNLHLQRNIYWYLIFSGNAKMELTFQYRAFGIDNRVARLNYDIGRDCEWPNPYLLSGIIRRIAYPIKGFLTLIKKALVYLGRYIREQICVSSHTGNTEGDVESGEGVRREEAEAPEASSSESPAEKAMVEFRGSLQKSFSDAERVKTIMNWVRAWGDGR